MNTPFPIIETDRLLLRKVNKDDTEDLLVYLSDQEVVHHMGLVPFQTTEDASILKFEILDKEES